MRDSHESLLNKVGRGVAIGALSTSLVMTGVPAALLAATQTVALAEESTASTAEITEISTADQLVAFATSVNNGTGYSDKTVKLTADIDLTGVNFTPIGTAYFTDSLGTAHAFAGTFEGDGHTITGLTVSLTDTESNAVKTASDQYKQQKTEGNNYKYNENTSVASKGLFGNVTGTVQNLTISGATISGANAEGAVVGYLGAKGKVSGVTVRDSTVSGTWENAGAVVGQAASNVTVENCTVDHCAITLPQEWENQNGAGGLVGRTQGGSTTLTGNTVTQTTVTAYRKAAQLIGYILSPTEIKITGDTLSANSVNVSPNAALKYTDGTQFTTYSGVYLGEIQANTGQIRAYETTDAQGNISLQWVNKTKGDDGKDQYAAATTSTTVEGLTLPKINDTQVSFSGTSITTATLNDSASGNKDEVNGQSSATASLDGATVSIDGDTASYTGSAITPAVTVTTSTGAVLTEGTDYDVTYKDNTNPGTATITVTGKGLYAGTLTKTFAITADISRGSVAASVDDRAYTGSAIEPGVSVSFAGTTLKQGTDYDVAYANNTNPGTATITITGKGSYSGTITLTFKIVDYTPAAATQQSIFRLYNQWSGEHLFTTSEDEYNTLVNIGWSGEKVAWTAPTSGTEVYRLYNPYSGDHHYTSDKAEYDQLATIGWNQEGVAFYSADKDAEGAQAVYRLFNPWLTQGTHLFTTDADEYASLGTIGWQQEGTAFYGITAE